jgi:hypothetical protein
MRLEGRSQPWQQQRKLIGHVRCLHEVGRHA